MKQKIICDLIILTALLLLTACGPKQVHLDGKTMGTWYGVTYLSQTTSPSAHRIKQEIDQHLELLKNQMSTYQHDSELSQFNQSREINQPFLVSAATVKVVKEAIRLHQLTEGALDITLGPLVNLWGFGPQGHTGKVPDQASVTLYRSWTGMDKLQAEHHALIKHIPELYVDLSAIAKGYGVDVIAEYLQSLGINNYMVNIGGEIRTRGHNGNNQPWRIAIATPHVGLEQQAQRVLIPGSLSLATSGDYGNYFEENGVRYSHTLDPKTGRPVSHRLVSVTVLHPSCMTADGLATGLNVLGPDKGMMLANSLDIPVLMIVKTDQGFKERHSNAFKPYL